MGKTETTTTSSDTTPWTEQQPFIKYGWNEAADIYQNNTPQYFTGDTVAGQSDATRAALNLQEARALNGNPLVGYAQGLAGDTISGNYLNSNPANNYFTDYLSGPNNSPATQYMTDTANGSYLNGNPFLDATFDRAASKATEAYREGTNPAIDGSMVASGRYGSGAWANMKADAADAFGENLTGMATDIYGGNYEAERGRQLQAQNALQNAYQYGDSARLGAMGNIGDLYGAERANQLNTMNSATGLANADYTDLAALSEAGAMRDAYDQTQINSAIDKFNWEQTMPMDWLSQYQALTSGGGYSSTNTETQTPVQSPLQTILGAGLSFL